MSISRKKTGPYPKQLTEINAACKERAPLRGRGDPQKSNEQKVNMLFKTNYIHAWKQNTLYLQTHTNLKGGNNKNTPKENRLKT